MRWFSECAPNALRRRWWLLGFAALWSAPVCIALVVEAPLGAADARELSVGLLGAASARYLGYGPMPLLVYFFASMAARPLMAIALALYARAAVERARSVAVVARAYIEVCALWLALAWGGALVVGVSVAEVSAGALTWAREVAWLAALSGLPCLALATAIALLARRALAFWSLTVPLVALLTLFSLGLGGDRIAPVLPGVIEVGLTSGREALRTRAILGALSWPLLAFLVVLMREALRRRALPQALSRRLWFERRSDEA